MFKKIFDAIDCFTRWVDERFILLGDELPDDIRAYYYKFWRIIDYIPILWRDQDYDCMPGIFALMKKKLERLIPVFVHWKHTANHIKRMKICVTLLDRIVNDYYHEQFHEIHNHKWGKAKVRFVPYLKDSKYEQIIIDRIYVVTPEDEKQESREYMSGYRHAQRQEQLAIDYVMKTVGKYAVMWWD